MMKTMPSAQAGNKQNSKIGLCHGLQIQPEELLSNISEPAMKHLSKRKLKKAPQAPRRFKSAYMFYSTWKHKDIREQFSKQHVSIGLLPS